jgi:hypothetical protein
VVLSVLKVASDETEKDRCACLSVCHYSKKALPPRYTNLGLNNRFGSEAVSCTILKPKHISRQVEQVDLAPTV